MTANGWFQIGLFLAVIFLLTKPLGIFLVRVFERKRTILDSVLRPLEKLLYRITGVDENREMPWTEYGIAMLLFSGVSMLVLYLMERLQHWLPFNPQTLANVTPDLAWNTAASFTTNTNWQVLGRPNALFSLGPVAGMPCRFAGAHLAGSRSKSQTLCPGTAG
jgi:K+-transporting ATPase ATPase A chain